MARGSAGPAGRAAGEWPALPPELAGVIKPRLDDVAREMIEAIQHWVPEYARPLDSAYRDTLRLAVTCALAEFARRITDPGLAAQETARLFRNIGRFEAAAGRSLEPLQLALRVGARVAWRQLRVTAGTDLVDIDVLGRVGEAIFFYLDELAAACSDGFAEATAETVGELQRRRRRLIDLIIADPPAAPQAIRDLALTAGWALPATVVAVALGDRGPEHPGSRPALPAEVLIDLTRPEPCLLVPDPDGPGRRAVIVAGLRGWTAAVGPVVPLSLAGSSLRWARRTLVLARRGIVPVPAGGIVRCDDHLGTLVLRADEELLETLAQARLAPLLRLRPAQRGALAETLRCWLSCGGNANEAALRLHIHPQTARYRLRQLRELFGSDLDCPDRYLDLRIALQCWPLPDARLPDAAGDPDTTSAQS